MKPYRAAPDDPNHHAFVTDMFEAIAPRYDRLNKIMTLGLDIRWRRQLISSLRPAKHPRVLDACTGTGDVAHALSRRGHSVVGVDGARRMLSLARKRRNGASVSWCEADCLRLPVPDASFDAVTISFGIRNIADRVGAIREFCRVVRPGGLLLVLEALAPETPLWGRAMRVYQRVLFPIIGALFAGNRPAYEYLARSIAGFGTAAQFEADLRAGGFRPLDARRLTGGSVVLFRAKKPT